MLLHSKHTFYQGCLSYFGQFLTSCHIVHIILSHHIDVYSKALQRCTVDGACCVFQMVMSNLQSILENVDTPELLCQSVKCILQVAHCYPHVFSTNFRVSIVPWLRPTGALCSDHSISDLSSHCPDVFCCLTGHCGHPGGLAH